MFSDSFKFNFCASESSLFVEFDNCLLLDTDVDTSVKFKIYI